MIARNIPTAAKYKNLRLTLRTISFITLINIFILAFIQSDYYFISACSVTHVPRVLITISKETPSLNVLMIALSALYALSYLLFYIFSEKQARWLLVSDVLFGADFVFYLIDPISHNTELPIFLFGIFMRLASFSFLIAATVQGYKLQKERLKQDEVPVDMNRQLTLQRKLSFRGCFIHMIVYANGQEIGSIKNGQTKTFAVPSSPFELNVTFDGFQEGISKKIEGGSAPISYRTKAMLSNFVLERTE